MVAGKISKINFDKLDRIEIFDEYEKIMIKEFIELVR